MDIVYCFGVLVIGCIVMMIGAAIFAFAMADPFGYCEGPWAAAKIALGAVMAGLGMAVILSSLACTSVLIERILGGGL